jgi:macrolide-specific efflux system membrane fusion protein
MSPEVTLVKPVPPVPPLAMSSSAQSDGIMNAFLRLLSRHKTMAIAMACAATLGLAYVAYSWNSDTSAPSIVVSAARGDIETLVTAIGNLQPLNTVDVGAQVSGQLKALHVKIGDETHKGDLVAEIDSTVAAAKVDADQAQLLNFRAQLSDKLAAHTLTDAQANRQTRLKNKGATSQDAFDIVQSAQRSGAAQVKAVQAQITQAQSTLKADQATLGYARVYAPMTGTVTAIPAKEGQTLNANQQAPNEPAKSASAWRPGRASAISSSNSFWKP